MPKTKTKRRFNAATENINYSEAGKGYYHNPVRNGVEMGRVGPRKDDYQKEPPKNPERVSNDPRRGMPGYPGMSAMDFVRQAEAQAKRPQRVAKVKVK